MYSFLIVFLKIQLCLIAGVLLYELILKNDTFFQRNRHYLLGIILASVLLPFLPIEGLVEQQFLSFPEQSTVSEPVESYLIEGNSRAESDIVFILTEQATTIPWELILICIYGLGVLLGLLRFGIQLRKIQQMIRQGLSTRNSDYTLVDYPQPIAPFSFFRHIFWHSKALSTDEQEVILRHELAHVRGQHSYDLILIELVRIFSWCNPCVYLLRHRLREVHEFLADQSTCTGPEYSPYDYGQMLLQQLRQRQMWIPLPHHFAKRQLLRRLLMLSKSPSDPIQRFKFFMGIPLLALILALGYSIFPSMHTDTEKKTMYFVWDQLTCGDHVSPFVTEEGYRESLFMQADGSPHPILDKYHIYFIAQEIAQQMENEIWLDADSNSWVRVLMEDGQHKVMPYRNRLSFCMTESGEFKHAISSKLASNTPVQVHSMNIESWLDALATSESHDVWLDIEHGMTGLSVLLKTDIDGFDPWKATKQTPRDVEDFRVQIPCDSTSDE